MTMTSYHAEGIRRYCVEVRVPEHMSGNIADFAGMPVGRTWQRFPAEAAIPVRGFRFTPGETLPVFDCPEMGLAPDGKFSRDGATALMHSLRALARATGAWVEFRLVEYSVKLDFDYKRITPEGDEPASLPQTQNGGE